MNKVVTMPFSLEKSNGAKISVEDLKRLKSLETTDFILIEVRDPKEYKEKHVNWRESLNVPPKEIRPERIPSPILHRMEQKSSWDYIILMDNKSQNLNDNPRLKRLTQQLHSQKIFFCEGGFEHFSTVYPNDTGQIDIPDDQQSISTESELNRSFRVSPVPSVQHQESPAFKSGAISLSSNPKLKDYSPGSEASLSLLNVGMLEEDDASYAIPTEDSKSIHLLEQLDHHEKEIKVISTIDKRLKEEVKQKIEDKRRANSEFRSKTRLSPLGS